LLVRGTTAYCELRFIFYSLPFKIEEPIESVSILLLNVAPLTNPHSLRSSLDAISGSLGMQQWALLSMDNSICGGRETSSRGTKSTIIETDASTG
jgi:hypothetical protein